MTRLTRLYRIARTVIAIWSWKPPAGMECFVAARWAEGEVVVILESGRSQVGCDDPWTILYPHEVRDKLDALAVTLGEYAGRGDEDGAWWSPTVVQAGLHFQASIERVRRAMDERKAWRRQMHKTVLMHYGEGGP